MLEKISSSLKNLTIPNSDPRFDLFGVFEASYDDLNADDKKRFRYLAAFDRTGFSLSAAAYVWSDEQVNANAAMRALLNLSLVKMAETDLERYLLHDLLDEYTDYKLKQDGGEEQAFTGMAEWLIKLFGDHYTEDADTTPEVTFELDNLQKAIRWATANKRGATLALLATRPRNWLFNYWRKWEDWQAWLEASLRFGIDDQQDEGKQLKANVLQAIGDVQQFRKENDAALESYNEALKLFKAVGARLGEANVLQAIGDVQQFRDERDAALESYNEALKLFKAVGDRLGEANVDLSLGDQKRNNKDYEGAKIDFQNAFSLYQTIVDQYSQARALYRLGDCLFDEEQNKDALEYYEKALQCWNAIGATDLIDSILAPRIKAAKEKL